MPNVTIYLDKESWDLWQTLPKSERSAFVQRALKSQGEPPRLVQRDSRQYENEQRMSVLTQPIQPVIMKDNEQVVGQIKEVQQKKKIEFCQHGNVKGFCKKGCK